MKLKLFDLQLFAEGGDAGPSTESGADVTGAVGTEETPKGRKGSLENVSYGIQDEDLANPEGDTVTHKETKAKAFENLIKGEYKEEFDKRAQGIINNRFKETKQMQETIKSHDSIMKLLSEKYGVDANDVKALTKAVEDDESFYQQEAMEKGLTIQQLKEVKRLERENEEFRAAQAEAERKANSQRIYSQWMDEGKALSDKYGVNFDFETEVRNPDFTNLLAAGVSVESAYMAIHFDDMVGGAMAQTAKNVRQKMANNIQSRQSRPAENGVSSNNTRTFKTDVNSLTKRDREEIDRRVARGEIIRF